MKRKIFLTSVSALFITLMVFLAQMLDEPEIIFPEVAALTVGAWLNPVTSWKTNKLKMSLLIIANAFLGVALVRYIEAPVYIKTGALILICFAELDVFRTSFAPMICAAVLPVYLGTRSFIYPVSASCFVLTVVLIQFILEKSGLHNKGVICTSVKFDRQHITWRLKQWAVLMIISVVPLTTGNLFFIAPPLIVGFTELSDPSSGARKHPVKIVVLTACCSVAGAVSRLVLTTVFGLPLFLSAFVAAVFVLCAMQYTKLFFPPAGAVTILSMLIPQNQLMLYPLKVSIGFTVLTLAAMYLFGKRKTDALPYEISA